MKKRRSACFVLLVLFIFTLSCLPAWSRTASSQTLRVGFFPFPGYQSVDKTGRRSGYGYEFLQRLAVHAGWNYEYVGCDASFAETLDMLRKGEVDIVTSISKTPAREKEFLFSNKSIGNNSTIFTVKAGNQKVVEKVYSTYNGLRVGMLEGNSKNANFERFALQHNFSFQPVYFQRQDALADALQKGEVDATVTGSLRLLKNEWLLEAFDASPFYICTRKDRPELMEQINEALDEMDMHEPNWREMVHREYFSVDVSNAVIMNAKEREFLKRHQESGRPLRLLFNPERNPYCYFQDGQPKGILPAIFEELAKKLSLKYEYIPVQSRYEYYKLLASGEPDVVLDFISDYYLAEKNGYKIAGSYLQTNFARLTLEGFTGEIKRIAMIERADGLNSYIASRYPNAELISCATTQECVQALLDKKADATIFYVYIAERYAQADFRKRFSSVALAGTSFSYAVNNKAEGGGCLLSLLHKGASSFTNKQLDDIVAREIAFKYSDEFNLLVFLYRNPIYALLGAVLPLLFIFVMILLIMRNRDRRRLKEEVNQATSELKAKTEALSLANKAKTTFLNNMSHDIRTPMNAIIGYAALTTTHLDNKDRARDYLSKIAQASNHLLSLINDVLDMSRIEAGNVTINERPENLANILQGLRNIIQSDIHAKRMELFIDIVDVVNEQIFCDKLRLNQILLNLTSNAIKFTPVGGRVAIRVTQKPSSTQGKGIFEFQVSDTGIGMSQEFVKTVFSPFTRERTSTVSGIQGTGLGMAITKSIVDMMGGTIAVKSEQGKGSTFTVTLELRFSSEYHGMGTIAELKGIRALVVDDDIVCCQSVSKMLRQIGMRAEWALSGQEAIARTSEAVELADLFEVYIVDWSMPELNGIETVRRIRKLVGNDSPIILMSAYDWSDIEQEARQAGVSGFISKPLFPSDLHRTLDRSLGHIIEEPETPVISAEKCFEGKRILLAEDNELNREIAVEILSEAGFYVETAENGQQACDKVRESPPGWYDLILMDIQMPIMDGYSATRVIRAMEEPLLAKLPIIAMTANAFEEDREKAMDVGMNGHLPKPIDVQKMLSLMRELFSKNNNAETPSC